MPLTMLEVGKEATVAGCRAGEETRKFLEGIGILPGTVISVVSELGGNLIVNIKGSRVALNKGLAQQLLVKI